MKNYRLVRLFCFMGPVLDFSIILFSGYISCLILYPYNQMHDRYWLASSVLGAFFIFFNKYNKKSSIENNGISFFVSFLSAWLMACMLLITVIYFSHASVKFSQAWFLMVIILGVLSCSAYRVVFYIFSCAIPKRIVQKNVYLIGEAKSIDKIRKDVDSKGSKDYKIVGVSDVNNKEVFSEGCLNKDIYLSHAKEIWLAMPIEMGKDIKKIMYFIRHQTADVRFFPDVSEFSLVDKKTSDIVGNISIDISVSSINGWGKLWKRLEDIFVALVAIVIFSPLFFLIPVLIKLNSKGPIIFKQYRTGVNGNKFKVYKFRSMVTHNESFGEIVQASRNDSRVTKIGAFLRKSSLDEIPQLYNVLQGRMSIVGPRPHALAHNEYYKDLVESYMQRHKVKPGITGWAQVCGFRGETDTLEKMQKRVQKDIWYICNWSILLDMKIMFLTLFKGFFNSNAY